MQSMHKHACKRMEGMPLTAQGHQKKKLEEMLRLMKSYHQVLGKLLHQTDIVSSKWNAVIITSIIYS